MVKVKAITKVLPLADVDLKAWVGNREDRRGRLIFGERRLENEVKNEDKYRKVKKSCREDRKIEDEASLEDRKGINCTGRKPKKTRR